MTRTHLSPSCKSPIPFGRHMLWCAHVTPPTPVVRRPFTRFRLARNMAWNPEQLEISASVTCVEMYPAYFA
jgi:hypothetical protein